MRTYDSSPVGLRVDRHGIPSGGKGGLTSCPRASWPTLAHTSHSKQAVRMTKVQNEENSDVLPAVSAPTFEIQPRRKPSCVHEHPNGTHNLQLPVREGVYDTPPDPGPTHGTAQTGHRGQLRQSRETGTGAAREGRRRTPGLRIRALAQGVDHWTEERRGVAHRRRCAGGVAAHGSGCRAGRRAAAPSSRRRQALTHSRNITEPDAARYSTRPSPPRASSPRPRPRPPDQPSRRRLALNCWGGGSR